MDDRKIGATEYWVRNIMGLKAVPPETLCIDLAKMYDELADEIVALKIKLPPPPMIFVVSQEQVEQIKNDFKKGQK